MIIYPYTCSLTLVVQPTDRLGLLKEALINHGTAFDDILDLREIRKCFINT
jgi:hypothetical protein